MKQTLSYLKYSKKEAILGPLFKMLEVFFELMVPLMVSSIIDNGIKAGTNGDLSYIIKNCIFMLLLALAGLASAVIAQYFSAKAAVSVATYLRNDLFKKIESLNYDELDKIGSATLITRLTSDVNQVQTGINMVLRLLLRSPVVIIGAVVVAFTIDTKVGLIFLATVPALFILIFVILLITIPLYNKSQEKLDIVVRRIRENLDGVRVIRAFNRQGDEKIAFSEENNAFTKKQIFASNVSALTNPLTFALINIFVIFIIYAGGIEVNSGTLSQGNVVALYSLSSQILVEMVKFANLIITVSKSIASSSRVEKILAIKPKIKHEKEEDSSSDYAFEVNNISMNYPASKNNALSNISFKVKKGETVGIIGGTGSGKTTLINVLMHNYEINDGSIYYNGKNLNSYEITDLRNDIALVPQKAKLFKGTIASNLKWGKEDATKEEMEQAIALSQSDDILLKKEKGLDEEVKQDGRNFSGGQKQRLCIARALIKKSPVLILDDSSSALDYATDAKLRKSLRNLSNHPTVFIISQRTASLSHADLILVLDEGKLVGSGTHEELLKNCSVYKEIYFSQTSKEEN